MRGVKWCYKKSYEHELKDNKWLYEIMLSNCNIDLICMQDFMIANSTEDKRIEKYLKPDAVYFLPVDKNAPLTWLMADILNIFTKYGVNAKDFILVHISDETRPPHTGLTDIYGRWKKVIRNFWWDEEKFIEYRNQGHLKWFPLGYLTVPKDKNTVIKLSTERSLNLTFLGNKFGNIRRAWHLNDITRETNLTIHGEVRSHGFRAGNSESYMKDMLNTKFCLNIRGRMSECYRFYEALEMGCIPVIIDKYSSYDYTSDHIQQYSPLKEVPWHKKELPFIWAKDVKTFATITTRLLSEKGSSELIQMQRDCAEWWNAVKEFYRKQFTELICFKD
eukprot:gene7154-14568_t